ncbi:uncharacterized protein LOC26528425 isoform X1 [Drosophila mojavensis]|uniref:F-box domain-containing protein n=2 Tax=Drosophila mojavensis TaxID=7230 RepID=A0A0Q9XDC5_DROMO|nr:uncharacterized protein LOC26528425 isoform X1 [Drosophila mojavensis]KRG06575.1 uncharacterized protein Dmoj_GI26784 [Drosophila mojavensis]
MSKTILDLNDDCIECLFKCLPIDTHLSFARVCTRFRNVWLNYRKYIYARLEVGETSAEGFQQELLLLRQISEHVKHLTINMNRNFDWSGAPLAQFMAILPNMSALERVLLWIKENESHKTYECILRALELLPRMQGIATYQDNNVIDSVYQFNDCESLLRESAHSRDPLMEFIENHTKIRVLLFNDASIRPTLEDLVRHSTCVKELTFRMTQKAAEYVPLAELPALRELHIFGNGQQQDCCPLLPLVKAISSKLSQQLHTLTINAPGLGYPEACEIARINSLQRLDCHLTDPQCLEPLIALNQLTELFIQLPDCSPIDDLVLDIMKHCQKLNVLRIDLPNLGSNFLAEAYKLLQQVRDPSKQEPLILLLGINCTNLDKNMNSYLKVIRQE